MQPMVLCKFVSVKHTGKKAAPSPKAKLEDYIPIIRNCSDQMIFART